MYKVILICVSVIIVLVLIAIRYKKKGAFILKKINVAEEKIDNYLKEKKELLELSIPLLAEDLKLEDFLTDFDSFFEKEVDNYETHDFLNKSYISLKNKIFDITEKRENKELNENIDKLKKCDIELSGVIKYYNDTCSEFNLFIKKFPVNLFKLVFRYKKKVLFNEEKKKIFDILNDK